MARGKQLLQLEISHSMFVTLIVQLLYATNIARRNGLFGVNPLKKLC